MSRLLAGSALAAPALLAGSFLTASVACAQPVSGIYVGLGGGANFLQDETVRLSPAFPSGKDRFGVGYAGVGSVGYGFGNGVRVELEGNYRDNTLQHFRGTAFPTEAGGHQQNYGGMANALFDMDIGKSWLYPYIGVGAGYSWTHLDTHYAGTDFPYAQRTGGTFGNLAYQAMFGLSVPVPWVVGLSMTAEYRFFSVLGPERFSGSGIGTAGSFGPRSYNLSRGNQDITTDYNHSMLLGLRYEFNPAPPPPPPPAVVQDAAPAPAPTRTYLVFFDWDRSDLSDRARLIIAEAAQASTHVQTTRVEVNGYTDTSAAHPGPRGEAYNQALSLRRAKAVQSELVHDGVPSGSIDIHGYGESHPLVAAGANTREPQNRRVEIVVR